MSTVLITGGAGLLGAALVRAIPAEYEVWASYFHSRLDDLDDVCHPVSLDIRDRQAVLDTVARIRPAVIIHTASIGNVDYCETHKEESRAVNVEGTRHLIEAALQHESRIVHLSSNAVFDGNHAPYAEDDPPNPIHYYGRTKLESERVFHDSGVDGVLIRPILMYGWHRPGQRSNFVTWLLNTFQEGAPVRLLNDVFCNPLPASHCAEAIWRCVASGHRGCFHIAGRDRVNMYEFGREVARVFGYDETLLQSVGSDQLPQLVPRPKDTTYDTRKMKRVLGMQPVGLRQGLEEMKRANRRIGE